MRIEENVLINCIGRITRVIAVTLTVLTIHGTTQWMTVYDLEDLSLMLTFPSVDRSTRHTFSLAEFLNRIDAQADH